MKLSTFPILIEIPACLCNVLQFYDAFTHLLVNRRSLGPIRIVGETCCSDVSYSYRAGLGSFALITTQIDWLEGGMGHRGRQDFLVASAPTFMSSATTRNYCFYCTSRFRLSLESLCAASGDPGTSISFRESPRGVWGCLGPCTDCCR